MCSPYFARAQASRGRRRSFIAAKPLPTCPDRRSRRCRAPLGRGAPLLPRWLRPAYRTNHGCLADLPRSRDMGSETRYSACTSREALVRYLVALLATQHRERLQEAFGHRFTLAVPQGAELPGQECSFQQHRRLLVVREQHHVHLPVAMQALGRYANLLDGLKLEVFFRRYEPTRDRLDDRKYNIPAFF